MYDDIIHLAMDQQYITEIQRKEVNYKKLPLWKELQKEEGVEQLEQKLNELGDLTFDKVFAEPVGYHLIRAFLATEHSVDKAVFIADVNVYKTLTNPQARAQVAPKIFQRFCAPEIPTRKKGVSVFGGAETADDKENAGSDERRGTSGGGRQGTVDGEEIEMKSKPSEHEQKLQNPEYKLSLCTEGTNAIGVYGRPITRLQKWVDEGEPNGEVFDEVADEVLNDLRLDVYPRFIKSNVFKMYLRCKSIEHNNLSIKDFHQMRMLGRGAFGSVNACKKKDTGKLYAVKQINKKRVQATESTESIMAERNFLASMDSQFVTSLKYAFMDETVLYLIMDLMIGGDLKFHLNNEKTFAENRSRFYAAEVLLGLEHIHSRGVIYRDLKLENVLVDDKGHCKISDLGLAVRKDKPGGVKGYAGTPGYTAPEVVLSHYYDHTVDFFSLGVMIYRFLCGKKPFQSRRRGNAKDRVKDQKRRTTELDRNVVEMEPDFPSQYFSPESKSLLKGLLCKNPERRIGWEGIGHIKSHPWFDTLDFGLLEAGYLDAPFVPPLDEINAEQAQHIGRPPQDEKFVRIKIKPELDEALKEFPFTSSKVIQAEIVEVLKKVQTLNRGSETGGDIINIIPTADHSNKSCLSGCTIL